jgi:DNA-binding SARP family transcriptional activator/TolB-like protein
VTTPSGATLAPPRFRLQAFGTLRLVGLADETVLGEHGHQRRRLALLAVLAASGEQGRSRDQLLGLFWPEVSQSRARHSLDQLLYAIRTSLDGSVFTGVNPTHLNAAFITSDVGDFTDALARGELETAVELYRGPFLEGFYLSDALEFEQWMETERGRIERSYTDALERLAKRAEDANDFTAAARWRQKLIETDPLSSKHAIGLIRALVNAGDHASALRYAERYEGIVGQELGTSVGPAVAALVAEVRARARTESVVVRAAARSPQPPRASGSPAPVATMPRKSALPTVEDDAVEEPAARRRNYWWPAGISLGATILFLAALSLRGRREVPALEPNKIVIVPFRTSGVDSSVKYLGEGVVDLIAPMLTGEGGPIAVDSRTAISTWNRITRGRDGTAEDARQVARELGAELVLTGAVVEVGGRLTITGNVIRGAGNARPLASVSAPIDSVDRLLDQFVGQILARQSGVAETSVSAITSQSLPAIRAYLNGRAAYRHADDDKAIESFTRALDIDSTFALAALDLAVATGRLLRAQICRNRACRVFSIVPGFASSERVDDLFDRAVRLAWAYRFKLGRRDRPLLEALRGGNYPRASTARETLAGLERAISAAPDRPETHYLLGVLLLYQGPALGLSDSRARAEAAFRQASKLDPSYLAPLAYLVDVAAFDRDTAKLRRAGVLYLARDTVGPTADYVRWLVAVGTADIAAHRAIRARFRSLNSPTLDQIFLTSQMTGLGLEDADSATTIITENATDPLEKSVTLRRGQILALNRGRPSEATRLLRRMDELRSSGFSFRQFAIEAALFYDGERVVADSSARDVARGLARDTLRPLSPDALRQTSAAMASQSLWYLERGDTARVASATDWLRRHAEGQPRNRVMSVLLEMLIASRARRPEGVILRAFVDSAALDGCCEFPPFGSLLLARAYEESGDASGALRVIRRGVWYYPPRLLSTHLREEGRLATRLGDRAGAIRAYEHYLALRSNPEPALRAERDSIRAEVNRLKRGG